MYKISNFSDNDDVKIIDKSGPFEVIEYQRDLSVMPEDAQLAFFCSQMNVRKRQLKCELSRGNVTIQSGAMQWMSLRQQGSKEQEISYPRRSVEKLQENLRSSQNILEKELLF